MIELNSDGNEEEQDRKIKITKGRPTSEAAVDNGEQPSGGEKSLSATFALHNASRSKLYSLNYSNGTRPFFILMAD